MSTLSSAALEQMLEPSYMSGVLLVDASGKRIAAKYYRDKSFDVKQQLAFEKRLLAKISRMPVRADPDCILFEKYIVVFRTYADARLIVLVCSFSCSHHSSFLLYPRLLLLCSLCAPRSSLVESCLFTSFPYYLHFFCQLRLHKQKMNLWS